MTPTVSVPVPTGAPGMLNNHTLATQLLSVQFVHGIVSITGVLKLYETVPAMQKTLVSQFRLLCT